MLLISCSSCGQCSQGQPTNWYQSGEATSLLLRGVSSSATEPAKPGSQRGFFKPSHCLEEQTDVGTDCTQEDSSAEVLKLSVQFARQNIYIPLYYQPTTSSQEFWSHLTFEKHQEIWLSHSPRLSRGIKTANANTTTNKTRELLSLRSESAASQPNTDSAHANLGSCSGTLTPRGQQVQALPARATHCAPHHWEMRIAFVGF